MDNKALWNSVCVTDPAAVKDITGKQYRGNSPKPYWIVERATDVFGPCGIGWGVEVVNDRFERFGPEETLHVALVRVWYMLDGKRGVIEQMGQTRSSYVTSGGKFLVDEDAPKKSVTDGMVKCLSLLGFAGDIFSGRWDDSKYVEFAAEEAARRTIQLLTPEQVTVINDLIDQTETKEADFLKWLGEKLGTELKSVSDIPREAYEPAVKALKKKVKPT